MSFVDLAPRRFSPGLVCAYRQGVASGQALRVAHRETPGVQPGWRRLADAINEEVPRLAMSWEEFARHARFSTRILRDLRAGARTSYDAVTISKLEAALGWEHGSAERVRAGRQPVRIPDAAMARVRHAWPYLSAEARDAVAALAEHLAR